MVCFIMKNTIAFILITIICYAYPLSIANAVTCFKKGEYVSGFNKICIYDCLGSDTALTIRNIDLCPLTINR